MKIRLSGSAGLLGPKSLQSGAFWSPLGSLLAVFFEAVSDVFFGVRVFEILVTFWLHLDTLGEPWEAQWEQNDRLLGILFVGFQKGEHFGTIFDHFGGIWGTFWKVF